MAMCLFGIYTNPSQPHMGLVGSGSVQLKIIECGPKL